MTIDVRCFSRGGNTKRLADSVASALGVAVQPVSAPMTERADIVFLCASVYAGAPDKAVSNFIRQNAQHIGELVVLSTSASGRSTHARIRAIAADVGVAVSDAYFHCPGAFMMLHRGRPNDEDCAQAAAFALAQCKRG